MPGPDPTPVAGAEAYTRRDRNARLSQAAIVLSLGAAAAGQPERVERPDAVGLPADLAPLGQREPVPLEEAVAPLGITADEQRSRSGPAVPSDTRVALMDQVVADPNPTNAAALGDAANQAATAVAGPDAATAMADAGNALTAVADDTTIKQGQALILDATKSAGNISDYKWTIEKAPSGAETMIGQTIKEGSSGNVSLEPNDYLKYFPQPGPYTVRLTVKDTAGKTATDDFEVMVP